MHTSCISMLTFDITFIVQKNSSRIAFNVRNTSTNIWKKSVEWIVEIRFCLYFTILRHIILESVEFCEKYKHKEKFCTQLNFDIPVTQFKCSSDGASFNWKASSSSEASYSQALNVPSPETIQHRYCFISGRNGSSLYVKLGASCEFSILLHLRKPLALNLLPSFISIYSIRCVCISIKYEIQYAPPINFIFSQLFIKYLFPYRVCIWFACVLSTSH